MREQQHNLCELLLEYMAGDCSQADSKKFEQHLNDCATCKRELEEMGGLWGFLPFGIEEAEVPAGLKPEVMESIFGREEARKRKWIYPGIAAALLVLWLAVYGWNGSGEPSTGPLPADNSRPAQVVRTIALHSTDSAQPDCGGTVWHMRKDDVEQVVVQLHGLTPNQGTEAYQVWLIHNGIRRNGGTLVVNEKGEGIMTYTMEKEDPPFEAVGVTLEPDANGTAPRGRKVLGS